MRYGNVGSRHGKEGTRPFLETPGGFPFEDHLVRLSDTSVESTVKQFREVEVRTEVPEFNPVRSRVTPDGTAKADKTMVAQDFFDLLASEAPLEPEKVQVVALLERSGAAVGSGAGRARTEASAESTMTSERVTMTIDQLARKQESYEKESS